MVPVVPAPVVPVAPVVPAPAVPVAPVVPAPVCVPVAPLPAGSLAVPGRLPVEPVPVVVPDWPDMEPVAPLWVPLWVPVVPGVALVVPGCPEAPIPELVVPADVPAPA